MEKIFHSDETGCQCTKRIFLVIAADISVCTHRQVHGPHEDCTIFLFKSLVEAKILPHAAAQPHHAVFLIRHCCLTFVDQFFDLLIQALSMGCRPLGAALPLGLHDCIDGIYNGNRNRMACRDHIADFLIIALLLIDQIHDVFEFVHIHHLAGLAFQIADQRL